MPESAANAESDDDNNDLKNSENEVIGGHYSSLAKKLMVLIEVL